MFLLRLRRDRPTQNAVRFEYGFAFAARRSASLFARRRASKYSPREIPVRSAQNTSAHRIPRPLLCRISSARLHCVEAIHSPRSARNAGHRFMKNSYQPFFPRSPYLFGARDTISTNYTCCAVCTFHLLACQYTAFGGMHHEKAPPKECLLFLLRLRRDHPTRASQNMKIIAMFCLSCNSSLARIGFETLLRPSLREARQTEQIPVRSSNPAPSAERDGAWVRICRSEIGKLVCQAKSEQIFAPRNSRQITLFN